MKEKKKLSPQEQDAKMSVLKEIMGEMDGLMSNDLDTKKKMKVSVMADSKKGLEKGLDKAEDIVDSQKNGVTYPKFGSAQEPGALMNEDDLACDSSMEPELEEDEDGSLSSDDLDKKIKKLMALKEQKSVKTPY